MASEIFPVKGLRLASAGAGIKYEGRDDVVLLELSEASSTVAVFTTNAFCAAPVTLAKQHLSQASPRYLLINSGNANAGTGDAGMQAAMQSCEGVADKAECSSNQVLPFSTGVIGQLLPAEKITQVIPELLSNLNANGWQKAAETIMTTDTVSKVVSRTKEVSGKIITVTGIAKGSGMIRPDMATMLAYVATDVSIDTDLLQDCLNNAVGPSFNSISVDGDTSTNDACVLIASGEGNCVINTQTSEEFKVLSKLVLEVCMALARKIVLDGEGATKLVDIRVKQAASQDEARKVAYAIAHSPLVKTAMFASDPNWGRILAAVGYAGLQELNIEKVAIHLGDICIVENGGVASSYTEEAGQSMMNQDEIIVTVSLGRGEVADRVLTCDLSYDYVKINAEYRT